MVRHFKQLFPLLLLIFIDSFSYFVVIPILLELFFNSRFGILPSDTSMAMRDFLTGFTISLSTIASLIASPFVGSFSDKHGRKKTLLYCLIAIIAGFGLPIIGIIKKNVFLILLGRLMSGIGSSSQPVAQASVTDLCKDEEKGLFLSLIAFVMTLPIILGPLVGGYLSNPRFESWFNATTPYYLALLISLFSLFIVWFFFQETMGEKMRSHMLSVKDIVFGLKSAIKNYRIGVLVVLFFCLELGWSQYYQTISLFLSQQFHYSVSEITLFNAYLGIFMSLGLLLVYPIICHYFSVKKIVMISIVLVFFGLFLCTCFPSNQWLYAWMIAIFTGIAYVALLTMISNQIPADKQGWIMGYMSTILFLAWMITGLIGGWLISIHSTLPLWIAVAGLFFGLLNTLFYTQDNNITD